MVMSQREFGLELAREWGKTTPRKIHVGGVGRPFRILVDIWRGPCLFLANARMLLR